MRKTCASAWQQLGVYLFFRMSIFLCNWKICFATLKPCLYPEEKLFAIRTHAACVQHASLEQSNFEFVFHFSFSKELNWLALTLKRLPRLAMFSRCKKSEKNFFCECPIQNVPKVLDYQDGCPPGLGQKYPFSFVEQIVEFGKCGTYCWRIILEDFLQQSGQYHTFCGNATHCYCPQEELTTFIFLLFKATSLFKALPVDLHSTPVTRSVNEWAEFQTSVD